MKRIIAYISLATALFFASCTEDKGNYDYVDRTDIIDVKISDIDPEGYEVALGDVLNITPTVTGLKPGREYSYEWYINSENPHGGGYVSKSLANTLELDAEVAAVPTINYFLYFKVTDVERNVYADYQTRLKVSASTLTTGWYVVKELDGMTDVDYCKMTTGEVMPDILSRLAVDDYRLKGSPVSIVYQGSKYNINQVQEDGTTKIIEAKALHVISTEDMVSFDAELLTKYTDLEEQFYMYPGVWNPQFAYYAGGMYLINDGELYTTSTQISGLSKFSSAKIRGGAIFPSLIAGSSYACYGFDMATRSFMNAMNYNKNSIDFFSTKTTGGVVYSSSDMEYEMVAIPTNSYIRLGNSRGVVMKSIVDGKYYTVSLTVANGTIPTTYPLGTIKEVPANSLLPKATAFTSVYGLIFCFDAENKLYYYDHDAIGDVKEFLLKEYPQGEKIVHLDFNFTNVSTRYISVMTWNSENNTWKLYIHPMADMSSISAFDPTPSFEFSGEGKPKMQICRAS